jgi:hypothetical protein
MPDYFKKNVNLFVALAPIAQLHHSTNGMMTTAAKFYGILEPTVKLTGMYDMFYLGDQASFMASKFCKMVPTLCLKMMTGTW